MRLTKYEKEAIVRAIMADVPEPDKVKRRKAIIEAVVKAMSPECRKVYLRTPDALATYYSGDVAYSGWAHNHRNIPQGDVPNEVVEAILKPYHEEDSALVDARTKLRGIVMSCNTLQQLTKLLPEFIKYFPTETAPTKNLPALANMVADLSKLGWPKGGKK